ncbi:COG1470 family protein [Actinokineospora xionganensis]|uniref:Ig-like domain-containing protein n=1 Tax=Actinokineospora xionganensis TaxID=2684470 RepID=A0ABR7L7A9_9PSEU|nr:hypothetical protein [Actinokineospora xionganensis]MBC6448585.1 hypothetical protein [Actinokineospora xionganensis]
MSIFPARLTRGDFAVSVDSLSVEVDARDSVTVIVGTTSGSRPQTLTMAAVGLPDGVTATFSPPLLAAGGSSRLTLVCGSWTPGGIHPVTITATNIDGEAASCFFSLTVAAPEREPGGARVWLHPAGERAQAGFATETRVTVTGGGAVRLAVRDAPAGSRVTFSPTVVYEGGRAVVWIFTAPDTPPGRYPITISATNARGQSGTAVFTLDVATWS